MSVAASNDGSSFYAVVNQLLYFACSSCFHIPESNSQLKGGKKKKKNHCYGQPCSAPTNSGHRRRCSVVNAVITTAYAFDCILFELDNNHKRSTYSQLDLDFQMDWVCQRKRCRCNRSSFCLLAVGSPIFDGSPRNGRVVCGARPMEF